MRGDYRVVPKSQRGRASGRVATGRALIGASILQTPGAIVDEINSIGQQVRLFDRELVAYLAAHGYAQQTILPMRTQLETLKRIDAGEYDGATIPDFWKVTQMKALTDGGFSETHAKQLLGNKQARMAEIAGLTGLIKAHDATAIATVPPAIRPLVSFYQAAWIPFFDMWTWWERAHAAWGDNFWTNHAPEAEKLLAQLGVLRSTAKKLGMPVMTPEPYNPDVGLWRGSGAGEVADAVGEKAGEVWKFGKIAAYGALGIAGVAAIALVARGRSVRSYYR